MHYASFAGFAIGLYHALNVGTDLTGTRGLIFAGIVAAPVLWLVVRAHTAAAPRSAQAPARTAPPAPSTSVAQSREKSRPLVPA